MPDVITVLQDNVVITQVAGADVLLPMAIAATSEFRDEAEAARDSAIEARNASLLAQGGAEAAETGALAAQAAAGVQAGIALEAAGDAVAAQTQAELAASVAGNPIFTSVANGEAATSDGDVFLVSSAAGTQVYENQAGTGVQIGWLGRVYFPTVAAMLAYTGPLTPVGTTVYAGRHRYETVSSGAHVTTAGGSGLTVYPGEAGYDIAAFGADMTGAASADTILAAADLAAVAADEALVLSAGTVRLAADIILSAPVIVRKGALLSLDAAVEITFNGLFTAGRQNIFTGDGVGPTFGPGTIEYIAPEWFGARATHANATPYDSYPGIAAAAAAASRGADGLSAFTYRIEPGQGVYHFGSTLSVPPTGLFQFIGQGFQTQLRVMDTGGGFPESVFRFTGSTVDSVLKDFAIYGGANRDLKFGIRADNEMQHVTISGIRISNCSVACIRSTDWSNKFGDMELRDSHVGIWLAGGANNNDITIDTVRFIKCEVSLVSANGANVRVKNIDFQGANDDPYTKCFAYVSGGTCLTFDNCYMETQTPNGGLAGMSFTVPEPVTIYAAIISNNEPYFTDDTGSTVTTTLSRNASPASRSNIAIRECLFSTASFYAAGAGGSGYSNGAVTLTALNGGGTGASATATTVGGKVSALTSITGGVGWQIGDEFEIDQGGNVTARGRVLTTTTANAIASVAIGGSAAIYPGNISALTIENSSMPVNGFMFALYNDPDICAPGRIVVRQTPAISSTPIFYLLGSNTTTVKAPLRNFTIDNIEYLTNGLPGHGVANYFPGGFSFASTPTVSTFTRQSGRYQGHPYYRFQLNAGAQTSDALSGSMTINVSGPLSSSISGRRVYLAVRNRESAANVKLRLTLSVTTSADTVTRQNYDSSTTFTKAAALSMEEVSIVVPSVACTLSWTIEVIAATAASQYVDLIGRPILSMGGVPVEAFPRWLSDMPMIGSAVWDAGSVASGTPVTTTIPVYGAKVGDSVRVSSSAARGGLRLDGEVMATNTVTLTLFAPGSTVDPASMTYTAEVFPVG